MPASRINSLEAPDEALDEALDEVTAKTLSLAGFISKDLSKNGFRRMHILVPQVRGLVKKGYSFYDASPTSIVKRWDQIWKHSQWYEVAHQALYYYQQRMLHSAITRSEFSRIKTWINRCDCWSHSDDLSKIYAQVVEDNPSWILPLYETWNRAKSPWKRRQSVVGLIEYKAKRKHVLPFSILIRFVDPLLQDEDYYVQKGVGWTLREIYNAYPDKTLDYIKANLGSLSAIAYSSSTEKLDRKTKAGLNSTRKSLRTS